MVRHSLSQSLPVLSISEIPSPKMLSKITNYFFLTLSLDFIVVTESISEALL